MISEFRRRVMGSAAVLLLAAAPAFPFPRDTLVVESGEHRHRFEVEVAVTSRERAQGLMFRDELSPAAGMLFLYPMERIARMWMKNTRIPLDMLFVAADGRIVQMAVRTVPFSEAVLASDRPVKGVLEVAGGTVERLGIRVGDRVVHPAFDSAVD